MLLFINICLGDLEDIINCKIKILMNIATYNRALSEQIKKGLNFAFTKDMDPEDEEVYFCNDTDDSKYRTSAKKHLLCVYFSCTDLNNIWNYCKQHLHSRHYPHFKMGIKKINHKDMLEIVVDDQSLTHAVKQYGNKEETGIITGKKKFDTVFEHLSRKLATIKRHFFGSPFQMMLETIMHNEKHKDSKSVPNFVFNLKPHAHQRVWLIFQKNQFSVMYGISFDDRSEQQLCKIYFSELVDAKKHVQNSPAVSVYDRQFPKGIIDYFPEQKSKKYQFTNGIISLTMFGSLIKKPEQISTYLANFRTYAYYHIQASKCYLHSRVLKRINVMQKDLKHSMLEPTAKN